MVFAWLDARDASEFGKTLALAFIGRMPVNSRIGEKTFEVRARAAMADLGKMVPMFLRQHEMNVYKKARLGNAFKWTLKDAGYQSDYADELTNWLLLQL